MSNNVGVRAAPNKLGPTLAVELGLLPSIPFHSQSQFHCVLYELLYLYMYEYFVYNQASLFLLNTIYVEYYYFRLVSLLLFDMSLYH